MCLVGAGGDEGDRKPDGCRELGRVNGGGPRPDHRPHRPARGPAPGQGRRQEAQSQGSALLPSSLTPSSTAHLGVVSSYKGSNEAALRTDDTRDSDFHRITHSFACQDSQYQARASPGWISILVRSTNEEAKLGMQGSEDDSLRAFCKLCDRLAAVSKYTEKTARLGDFLRQGSAARTHICHLSAAA